MAGGIRGGYVHSWLWLLLEWSGVEWNGIELKMMDGLGLWDGVWFGLVWWDGWMG